MKQARIYHRYKSLYKDKNKTTSHDFYRSYKWRKHRQAYINQLTDRQREEIPIAEYSEQQKILLLHNVPVCENCLNGYVKGWKPGIREGRILDHIKPVNPNNPMDTCGGIYGEPLNFENNQFLCDICHDEKRSKADKEFHKSIKRELKIYERDNEPGNGGMG